MGVSQKVYFTGTIPSPLIITNVGNEAIHLSGVFPTTFDLRSLNRLTPVRDQGQIGSCWSFAAYSSLESFIKTQDGQDNDFSENNLITQHGFDYTPNGGGNRDMAAAYLARWAGPVLESDDPYPNPPLPANIVYNNNESPSQHVQEVLFIPVRASSLDNDDIKSAVMQFGAVDTSMYMEPTPYNIYYNSVYKSYNYTGSAMANHDVAIVGWDDNYPTTNFKVAPAGNGAFIVRNNWGTLFGDNGYFYISYYDKKIGSNNAVFQNAEELNNYDGIYQYDKLGMTGNVGSGSSTGWFANVYPANAGVQYIERLSAVGFFTTKKNATYEIHVETDFDANGFDNMTLPAVTSGTIGMPGYHTIKLDTAIELSYGKKFAVAVKINSPGELYPIPVERPLGGYSSQAVASSGQSFISPDGLGGNWQDLTTISGFANSNTCLKAFTTVSDSTDVQISFNPTDYSVAENEGSVNLTVYRTVNTTGILTVNYATSDSSARAGSDYDSVSGTLTFADGEGSKDISVPILDNLVYGGNKSFRVTLSNPSDGYVIAAVATVTITENDPAPTGVVEIIGTNPTENQIQVPLAQTIAVTFDRNIFPGSGFAGITFKKGTVLVIYTSDFSGTVLTIDPATDLSPNSAYTVNIPAYGVKDVNGFGMGGPYLFSFKTPDSLAPTVKTALLAQNKTYELYLPTGAVKDATGNASVSYTCRFYT